MLLSSRTLVDSSTLTLFHFSGAHLQSYSFANILLCSVSFPETSHPNVVGLQDWREEMIKKKRIIKAKMPLLHQRTFSHISSYCVILFNSSSSAFQRHQLWEGSTANCILLYINRRDVEIQQNSRTIKFLLPKFCFSLWGCVLPGSFFFITFPVYSTLPFYHLRV